MTKEQKQQEKEEKKRKKSEQPQKTPAGKTRKIKLRLTQKQRDILHEWFGTVRWTYNQILRGVKVTSRKVQIRKEMEELKKKKQEILQAENENADELKHITDKKTNLTEEMTTLEEEKEVILATNNTERQRDIRSKYIKNENFKDESMKWVLETPFDVRDGAMLDIIDAYTSNIAKWKKNSNHRFDLKYKSKHAASDSIRVYDKHYSNGGKIFPTFWKGASPYLKGYERLPENLGYDTRLQRTKRGEFYLCVLSPLDPPHPESSYDSQGLDNVPNVISLDPGVRTFTTGYCPDGRVMECGNKDARRIVRLCHALDDLQSRWSAPDVRHRKRYRMRRAGARIRKKIRNLVDDLHCKLVKWLVLNFELVLLPKFPTQQMATKRRKDGSYRVIRRSTVRSMMTWSHYRFQQRLLNKTREYSRCRVKICDEDYTSKTCGNCGCIHWKLGGNKVFKCPSCGVVLDRDVNGARNILLRYLTLHRNL